MYKERIVENLEIVLTKRGASPIRCMSALSQKCAWYRAFACDVMAAMLVYLDQRILNIFF